MKIIDAPEVHLTETDNAGAVLIKFYKALGWDSSTEMLDPCKVRTSKSIFDNLYDLAYGKFPDSLAVGIMMVNTGPGVDNDIPDGKVYLLKGWALSDALSSSTKEGRLCS